MAIFGKEKKDDENKDDENQTVDPKQFKEMIETVGTLSKSMEQLMGAVGQMSSSISELASASSKKDDEEDDGDDEDETVSFDDLEGMSRADFAKHLGGVFGKELDKRMKDINSKIEGVSKSVGTIDAKSTFKELSSKYKDFKDWIPEMKAQVESKPGLTLEDAYQLVRLKDEKKAKELDEKYTEKKDDEKSNVRKVSFGGLTPTSGQTSSSEAMAKEDAAEAAWQETMSELDEAAIGDSK